MFPSFHVFMLWRPFIEPELRLNIVVLDDQGRKKGVDNRKQSSEKEGKDKRMDSSTDTSSTRGLSICQRITGFNGCIRSSEPIHVPMIRYPHRAQNSHKGFKLNVSART